MGITTRGVAAVLGLGAAGAVHAGVQTIGSVAVVNQSGANPAPAHRTFLTQSTLSGVTNAGNTASFTHRMAARNEHTGLGGVAQTNKGNVVFQIDFTVFDPDNLGFEINLESVIRNVSLLTIDTLVSGGGFATGLALGATFNDSTMAPGEYANMPLPIFGQGTPTTPSLNELGTVSRFSVSSVNATLGQYVGTTDFSFRFTSVTTPTTNVLFQNNATGHGLVHLGIGDMPEGFSDVDPDTLGHFLTVTAVFVPAPGAAALLALGGLLGVRRRR